MDQMGYVCILHCSVVQLSASTLFKSLLIQVTFQAFEVPFPKIANTYQANDFWPLALASLVMKILENTIKNLILTSA